MPDKDAAGENSAGESSRTLKEVGGYQLLSKIGQGGMGAVFKARQMSLDRIVALKILPPSIAKNAQFIERFQREARASAKLNHPNIVQGIDVGKDEVRGLWYFAMEMVDGPSLKQVLNEQRVISEERALKITADMARALECAANQGIVHRDIKPDNILLTPNGDAKLADLGLAKQITDDASVTQSGQAVGTPYYMAPEQVRGQADQIDRRTDIYALGGTLFHLVTGQPPFTGETSPVIMTKHLTEPPPKANKLNPEVSEATTRLIVKMMQKDKDQRVQTSKELLALIEKIQDGEDGHAATGVAAATRPFRETTGPRLAVTSRSSASRSGGGGSSLTVVAGVAVVAVIAAVAALSGMGDSDIKTTGVSVAESPRVERRAEPAAPFPSPAAVQTKPAARQKTPSAPVNAETSARLDAAAELIIGKGRKDETDGVAAALEKPAIVTGSPLLNAGEKPVVAAAEKVPVAAAIATPVPADTANLASLKRSWKGFKAEYFDGQGFENLRTEQIDAVIDFSWPSGSPPNAAKGLGVSVRWSGFVDPPESGDYTFEVSAQAGGRLTLDDSVIFDNWSGRPPVGRSAAVTLEKGKKYALQFEFRHKGSDSAAVAALKWSHGGSAATLVNADPPDTETPGVTLGKLAGGWKAEYGRLESELSLVTRSEPEINWNWGYASPAQAIPSEKFWGRWTGLIVPPENDEYTFSVDADEGARLFINDMLLFDFQSTGPAKMESPPVKLEKGRRYSMRLEYVERGDHANCALKWAAKTVKECLVRALPPGKPDGVLTPDGFLAEYGQQGSAKVLVSRRELTVNQNWKYGSPDPEIEAEKFWGRYTGWITPPVDGEYFFSLEYDEGVHLYLDDVMLFDSGNRSGDATKVELAPLHLKGGKRYSLRADFREQGDYARLTLSWRSAAMPKRVLTALIPEAVKVDSKEVGRIESGVLAEYGTGGKTPLLRRLEGRIYHDFHGGSPAPEIPAAAYWGRWTGGVRVPVTGNYLFRVEAEASAEMKLDNVSVVKVPVPPVKGAPKNKDVAVKLAAIGESLPLNLAKGKTYFLEMSFINNRGDYSYIKVMWKPPGRLEFEEIPPDAFLLPPQAREQAKRAR